MRILLCAINSKYIHSNPAVYTLKEACAEYSKVYGGEDGSNIIVQEYSINDSYESLLFHILEERPEILAFSCYIWNISLVGKLCADVKKALPSTTIILGGPEVSFGMEHTKIPGAHYDYVLEGEGEKSFYSLVSRLQNGDFTPPEENLELWPSIYTKESLPRFQNRIVYYESSRGCPYRCAYCLSGACGKVRYLPLERVFSELTLFCQEKVPLVKFTDRTANCNPARFRKILTHIKNMEPCQTTFHFEVGADLFGPEDLELLASMPLGRIQLEAGVQSTDPRALKACVRLMDTGKIFTSLKRILSFGNINLHGDLIAGLPYEDYTRFGQSFNDLYELRLHQLQLGFLKLLPGAPLNDMLEEYGYVFSENPPYEIIRNHTVSPGDLGKLKAIEDVLERYYNSGRFTTCLPMLEACFESPFALYERLSEFYRERGLIFSPISLSRQCDLLVDFASGYGLGEEFHKAMLYDWFSTNRQDLPPDRLKGVWKSRRGMQNGPNGEEPRWIGDRLYWFQYKAKNPVTGRFSAVYF